MSIFDRITEESDRLEDRLNAESRNGALDDASLAVLLAAAMEVCELDWLVRSGNVDQIIWAATTSEGA